jgi:phosphonate transport system substrate-binding protein
MIRFVRLTLYLLLALMAAAHPAWAEKTADKPVILFGVIPRYNPVIMYRSYQPLMDYLTEHTPYRFELKLSRDYTEAVELLRQGVTPIASLGDLTFAEACTQFGARPIVKPLNSRGHADYHSIIIVREDSTINTLRDLKGKTFAFGNLHSTSGNLIPRDFLFQNGITLFDLKSYTNLDSHDAVAKAVLKGKVEAGAVKDVIAYRYREHGLRLLAVSGPIPSVPVVVRKDAPAELVRAVESALLAIDPTDPRMRERMRDWDPEFRHGFVRATQEDYRPIFQLLESIPGGCGSRCH